METTDGSAMSSSTERAAPKKGIKVHLFGDKNKSPVGVAASSLRDLINKACARFQISRKGVKLCLPDGTQVDGAYFDTLANQSTLVLLQEGESLQQAAVVRLVERLLAAGGGRRLGKELSEMLRRRGCSLRVDPAGPDRAPAGPDRVPAGPDRAPLSRRSDDPDWFKDLDTGSATKEEYMRRRCESRVRTYFYKSRDQVRAAPQPLLPALQRLMADMSQQLKQDRFHGHYFDRGQQDGRLCDERGQFSCQGAFSEKDCGYSEHRINPYRSREDRIVFSTWNLDHRIERSRTILPSLVKAAEQAGQRQVNWRYFYRLLFTTDNLRLVHIVCHDKACHDRFTCDQSQVFVH